MGNFEDEDILNITVILSNPFYQALTSFGVIFGNIYFLYITILGSGCVHTLSKNLDIFRMVSAFETLDFPARALKKKIKNWNVEFSLKTSRK